MSIFKIDYQPNASQSQFHASNCQYKAMVGALGSGKSATLCVEAIALSLQYPGNVGLIARKSFPELKMTIQKTFFNYLPDALILKFNQSDQHLTIKTSSEPSHIYFGPLDDLDRYKGTELGFFAVDEANETTKEMWLTLCGRLRLKKSLKRYGLLATNPTTVNHWIYDTFVLKPPKDYELFRSKTTDNAKNLPDGYVEQLISNYPEDWRKRFIEGEFGVIQEGDPVFPDFKEAIHVKPVRHTKGRYIMRGWDFGYHHPCVVFAEFDELQRMKVIHTILGKDEDLGDVFIPKVMRYCNENFLGEVFKDYCDIAGIQKKDTALSSVQVLNQHRVYPNYRYVKIEERNMELRKLLRQTIQGTPGFLIDPSNTYLIEGLQGGYHYGKKKEGVLTEEPVKDGYFDHGQDALGYIVANTLLNHSKSDLDRDFEIQEPRWRKMESEDESSGWKKWQG